MGICALVIGIVSQRGRPQGGLDTFTAGNINLASVSRPSASGHKGPLPYGNWESAPLSLISLSQRGRPQGPPPRIRILPRPYGNKEGNILRLDSGNVQADLILSYYTLLVGDERKRAEMGLWRVEVSSQSVE